MMLSCELALSKYGVSVIKTALSHNTKSIMRQPHIHTIVTFLLSLFVLHVVRSKAVPWSADS